MSDWKLTWNGDEIAELTRENVAKALSEFALTVEGESKRELRKGHGVLTGTLRRSIHTALPGYDWSGDDVENGPERGGRRVALSETRVLRIEVGSGMVYAMAVHQGHHNFSGYHYLTNGLKRAQGKLPSIIEKYKAKHD
jgi:hypothetical protein